MVKQAQKQLIDSFDLAYHYFVLLNHRQPRRSKDIKWIVRSANKLVIEAGEDTDSCLALGQTYFWTEYPTSIMQEYHENRKLTAIDRQKLAMHLIQSGYTRKETI